MYRVLEPVYEKTNEPYIAESGREGYFYRWVGWKELGVANDMKDAYAKFPRGHWYGYAHILDEIKVH